MSLTRPIARLPQSFSAATSPRHNRLSVKPLPSALAEPSAEESDTVRPSLLDIRVGKVLTVERHPEAYGLYIETIDIGDGSPRTVCSSLRMHLELETLLGAVVLVLCNTRAIRLRGVFSHGIVVCATDKLKNKSKPLTPPEGASIGERAEFDGYENEAPATEHRMRRKKIWEKLKAGMKTDADGVAQYGGNNMCVGGIPVTCSALPDTPIA